MSVNALLDPRIDTQSKEKRALRCTYGDQDVLRDAKCMLDCQHPEHAHPAVCYREAVWTEVILCHGEQSVLCEEHKTLVNRRIGEAQVNAAIDEEALECFECDGTFRVDWVRL